MIKLDVCCGNGKCPDFTGMDVRDLEGVDIVHDVCKFPWPLDDNSCSSVLMNLSWSCIEPKYRIQLMDEFWRVTAPDGKLQITDQYYRGDRAYHDPTYYSCPNEVTFKYFDPKFEKYKTYEPKPWLITVYEYSEQGRLTVVMTPIKEVVS